MAMLSSPADLKVGQFVNLHTDRGAFRGRVVKVDAGQLPEHLRAQYGDGDAVRDVELLDETHGQTFKVSWSFVTDAWYLAMGATVAGVPVYSVHTSESASR